MEDSDSGHSLIAKRIAREALAGLDALDIMVPSFQVELINIEDSFDEIIRTITGGGHSRFPVYENKIDNIVGVLYAKSLLNLFRSFDQRGEFYIRDFIRKPLIISENKKADDLLGEFIRTHIHMAIVVNEYRSMLGILTLEDILEEIFGEINDEFDREERSNVLSHNEKETIILPTMPIEEFNRLFKTRVKNEDFETISGFILDKIGHVPAKGDTLEYHHYLFEILEAEGSRILKIKVRRK